MNGSMTSVGLRLQIRRGPAEVEIRRRDNFAVDENLVHLLAAIVHGGGGL